MPTLAGALPRRAAAGYVSPRAVLVVMCVGYFLVLLDVTIVNVALPKIGAGLDAGVSGLQWVVDGYALALASLMLAGGTVGDLHGHRRVVLAGLIVFGAGSLLCGVAPTTGVLVAARLAQGVGAALLLPGTLAIISRAFPEPRAQARAIGIWAAIGSLALPAGPLAGGPSSSSTCRSSWWPWLLPRAWYARASNPETGASTVPGSSWASCCWSRRRSPSSRPGAPGLARPP